MKTVEELKKMDTKKLLEELNNSKKEFFKVRFEVQGGQSKNIHHVRTNRKHIAKIQTILNEKRQTPEEPKIEEQSK